MNETKDSIIVSLFKMNAFYFTSLKCDLNKLSKDLRFSLEYYKIQYKYIIEYVRIKINSFWKKYLVVYTSYDFVLYFK